MNMQAVPRACRLSADGWLEAALCSLDSGDAPMTGRWKSLKNFKSNLVLLIHE